MSEPRTVQVPWQGLLALTAAIAGAMWYFAPLDTSRPIERSVRPMGIHEVQDVDARIWQDPLLAAHLHNSTGEKEQKKCHHEEFHEFDALKQDMGAEDFWVLPVIVPGGSYAEYNEIRLRARLAVLEALGASGFSPKDGEHIGFIRLGITPVGSEIIPFEWCKHDPDITKLKSITPRLDKPRVLILWLREELFYNQPLSRLNQLLAALLGDAGHPPVRILGPRTSTSLRAMLKEVEAAGDKDLDLPSLKGVRMLSPTSTASEEALGRAPGQQSSKQLLQAKIADFEFERLTTTDDEVSAALIKELTLRHVLTPSEAYDEDLKYIALISEWDTFYGRMLPETFIRALPEAFVREGPENIRVYHYLRGVDGLLPVATDKVPEKQPQQKARKPSETTEGLNQADYLRRLAHQLYETDKDLRKEGKGGIKAIGVLGTDIYDKLLVLKSLRGVLPGTIFFTTSLDARFGHPDEWKAAHNLLVGSPFGLALHPDLQGRIPPFRDAYQTAVYAATLAAVDDSLSSRYSGFRAAPRIYEIGHDGPFDLTEESNAGVSQSSSKSGQPDNPNLRRWFTPERWGLVVGLVLLCGAAFIWVVIVIGVSSVSLARPERSSTSRSTWVSAPSWIILVVAGLASWLVVYLLAVWPTAGAEPFAWFDGISIWPTAVVRLLVFLMAIWYLLKTHYALKANEETIEADFKLERLERAPLFSERWRKNTFSIFRIGKWLLKDRGVEGSKVNAQDLWDHYIRAGEARTRFLRVAPLVAFYLGAASCLMLLLGFPPVPARGDWSFALDITFLILAVTLTVWVTFYVADATMLNRRLIDYLIEGETEWPPEAYANLRKRWGASAEYKEQSVKQVHPRSEETPETEDQTGPPAADQSVDAVCEPVNRPPDTILAQYLDIDLIAKRTAVVGALIYYPFVLISLLIVSRVSIFDNWTWPVPLLIVIGLNGGYAAWSAFSLRKTAERARQEALRNLNDLLIARTAQGLASGPEAQTARETISIINTEDRGAFAAISRHPLIGALLLPSGGAGLWVLVQYLPGLF